ncbi:MAG TPA: BNR-4 repeat-containing protein [Phycisphaerae bacterium]|nr:BNR-4 repeat-containing protein [Phycisphaerae bacterium]HRY67383.1 BNR-4 repeat-containing protein [Phycisphaerae bacterium]HSA29325.1 BNR-4 repeat-containing protein [Phycisphaerae bacterium]
MDVKRLCRGLAAGVAAIAVTGPLPLRATDDVAGALTVLNDNGAWCWYQGERAIIHDGKLIVGSVADASGTGGTVRDGNIEVATCDFRSGRITRFVLRANLEADDHNSPGLLVRPDGRYLAMYARHGSDAFSRWRISADPGDTAAWWPEQTFDHGTGATYSNLYRLSGENGGAGCLYDLVRTVGIDPNLLTSDDNGQTWGYAGRLLDWPTPTGDPKFTGSDGSRPYLRYASNGVDEIHFIASDDHPRAYDNSIYHGVIRGGRVYDSFGSIVDENVFDGLAKQPNDYTTVFDTDISPLGFAWTTDLRLDGQGRPYALFTARANNSDSTDHRFLYARFDGAAWQVHEIARAGGYLYASENDYTGLGALDPRRADTVYISTKIDPRTDSAGAHYEIYKGVTVDGGAAWTWTAVTSNSTVDNLRPVVPPSDGSQEALLWLRGTYASYTNFSTQVVALLVPPLACAEVPAVTVESPISPGATTATISGIVPEAESVHVYVNGLTMVGSAAGDPPNTPPTLTVAVAPLALNDRVSARQVVAGQESCAPASEVKVWAPLRITCVDADPNTDGIDGNTTINGSWVDTGTGGNATASASAGSGNDLKWHIRSRTTVNGGEVWEAGGAEVPPILITTLTLPAGTYDLYGLFWNNASNAGLWDVQFRVGSSGAFTTFNKGNAILSAADGSDFVNATTTRDDAGNYQVLMIAPLGRFQLTGAIDIQVRAADLVSGSSDDRTWYDGVGHAPVCNVPFADADGDQDVDQGDFGAFQACYTGPGGGVPDHCACFNRPEGLAGSDNDVDAADLAAFVLCVTGPEIAWSQHLRPDCTP